MTAKDHNKIFSILMMVKGGLTAFGGLIVALAYGGIGFYGLSVGKKEEDAIIGGIVLVFGVVIGFILLAISLVEIFAGWKMFKEQAIGRTLGIAASILSLFSFPLGTALGVYGLWFLFSDEGKRLYLSNNSYQTFQPPPPNSWR